MSEIMSSQKMQRTCDACGATKEWELVGVQEPAILDMQEWYLIIRNVVIEGRFTKIQVNACSLGCVPAAAVKLALPKQAEEPADDIDLSQLRAANFEQPN
jgi:hypothetical protein